ncbi:zinc-dependent alcohol dehydrogenase family protein [Georgenia sp. Z1344]|uniref:zinc-dependent alcohol dehydrogenase family protein n=1 Tax=Georgenia sp. Z1344 TaxID=3416706 RepID=UPI003CFA8752
MRATVLHAARDIRVEDRPDPALLAPTDAVVRITAACVCGSDLWHYRGIVPVEEPRTIGHEAVGVVEEAGGEVTTVRTGDVVVVPFAFSCGECFSCRNGIQTSCERGGFWGAPDGDGLPTGRLQAEAVRVPFADGTLVGAGLDAADVDDTLLAHLLTLSDVMGTGWHAARAAGLREGATVAVVGDGAVGLSAVLAASRLGASRVVAFSRYADRQALARRFGATDILTTRGDEAAEELGELLGVPGADVVLEAVGTDESMDQAIACARPGGTVGYVGVPNGVTRGIRPRSLFGRNVALAGGVAPARAYLPELLAEVTAGRIEPGAVFTASVPLEDVAEAYAAMDERREIKVMVRP